MFWISNLITRSSRFYNVLWICYFRQGTPKLSLNIYGNKIRPAHTQDKDGGISTEIERKREKERMREREIERGRRDRDRERERERDERVRARNCV